MTQPSARVLLAGYGLAGSAFHAPVITAAGMEVAGIVARDPARRAAAAARYPAATLLDEADPTGFDLVVVATPNRSHAEIACRAIEAGVPVVVDKPFARSTAEGRSVLALAERHGVAVTVFQNRRWDDDFLTLRSALAGGALGSVTRFESRFERWRPTVEASRWRESDDPAQAGGVLVDLGTHLVDQAIVLFGRPTEVHADVHVRRDGALVDDDVFIALAFPGGIEAHLWASMACPVEGPRLRVLGSAAGFESWGLDPQEAALRTGLVPGGPGWAEATAGRTARIGGLTVVMEPGRYLAFYEQVSAALAGRTAWPVDPADAVATQQVLEAARAAAATRQPLVLAH